MTSTPRFASTTAIGPAALARLRDIVGPDHVVTDPSMIGDQLTDWTGRYRSETGVVVRPGSTVEVGEIVRLCEQEGIAVVPQGGNTGLVGGGVATGGELTMSLRRFDQIGEVDVSVAQVTVGAGVTLAALQAHVANAGRAFGVDLAPRLSCTIGGMAATNAGGIHVVRHGTMRRQVMGLEAVIGGGAVVSRLNGLEKDNTGYDLAGLLVGSEGTLGVVTQVRLRLVPVPTNRLTLALGFAGIEDAVHAVGVLRASLPELEAVEFMTEAGAALSAAHRQLAVPEPFRAPVSLLIDVAGFGANADELVDQVAAILSDLEILGEPAVAVTASQRATLWAIREGHTEAIRALGIPAKLDVSVPLTAVREFLARLAARNEPGHRTILFGHLGDANLHVNVVGANTSDGAVEERVTDDVLRLVVDLGGSISAEHGIGVAKARYLGWYRSDAEISAFRAIKAALDPGQIFNPRVLLSR